MKLTPIALQDALYSGYANLQQNKSYVDKLNVFPVPDGDTGTNMTLTLKSAIEQLKEVQNPTFEKIADAMTKGSLMGARGNSGVILSQILRGFGNEIQDKNEIGIKEIAFAFGESKTVAYKAVIKPIEGTILTVIKEMATFALSNHKKYKKEIVFFEDIIKHGNIALKNTPNQLKELKEAGVVDSGGQGLMFFMQGILSYFKGENLSGKISLEDDRNDKLFEEDIHIFDKEPENAYCTEFILHSDKITKEKLMDQLIDLGDSMVVVGYDGVIKIHIHTNNPGKALEIAGAYGELDRLKIENMRFQFQKRLNENKETKKEEKKSSPFDVFKKPKIDKSFAIISVSTGDGIAKIMQEFGVDIIIEGGQTMNPSTNDFITAIESIENNDIIIFPNNSNIIMAANQAKEISKKNIEVIPTKNIPQCLQGLLAVNITDSFNNNVKNIMSSYQNVKSGQITHAVRDTNMDGKDIKEGDYIGLSDKKIVSSSTDIKQTLLELVKAMIDEKSEIITLFYGDEVKESIASEMANYLQEQFEDLEVELYFGGQKVYNYLISVE